MGGLVLDTYIAFAIRWLILLWRKVRSRKWPVLTGTIRASSYHPSGAILCDYAEIRYKYKTAGERYEGVLKKPYLFKNYGEAYVRHRPGGSDLQIRVNPKNRAQSMPVSF